MPQAEGVVKFIRGAASTCADEVPDAELLRRFASARDEQAFRAIVSRYGPVVWAVCRRLVRNHHDAEDAFQATLLVFTRKASELHTEAAIGSWLYAVAYRVASRVRSSRTHPPTPTQQGGGVSAEPADSRSGALDELTVSEAESALHEELARLPEKYRAPLVLCCLEGLSRDESATRLGWSANRVKHGLERGREILRSRLARRGISLGLPLLTTLLASSAGIASPQVIEATVRQATGTPPPVAISSLANGVNRTMWIAKWKWAVAGCVALVLTAGGTLAAVFRDAPPESPAAPVVKLVPIFAPVAVEPKAAPEPKKEPPKPAWDVATEYLQLIIDGKPEQAKKLGDNLGERYIKELQVAGLKRVRFAAIVMNDSRVMVITERAKLKRQPNAEPEDNHVTVTLERKDADSPWRVIENDVTDPEGKLPREIGRYLAGEYDFKPDPKKDKPEPKKDEKEPKALKPTWELAVEFLKLAIAEKTDEALKLVVPGTVSENKIGEIKRAGITGTKPVVILINEKRIEVAFEQQQIRNDDRPVTGHLVLMLVKSKDGVWLVKDVDFESADWGNARPGDYLGGKYDK